MKLGFLLLYPYSGLGGTEAALVNLVLGLKKKGVETTVFYAEEPYDRSFLDQLPKTIHVKNINIDLRKRISFIPKFISRLIQKHRFKQKVRRILKYDIAPMQLDAVIILDMPLRNKLLSKMIYHFKEKNGIKIYSWVHASMRDIDCGDIQEFKKLFELYDGHFAVSNGLVKEFQDLFNLSNVTLIYNAVQPAKPIKRKKNRFLFIGRITPIKRIYELLAVMEHLEGDWYLDIYGSSGDPEEDRAFQEYITSLKIKDRIIYHGYHREPWNNISEAGILLLNSRQESFGLVLVEAMMRGVPCISTNCLGPKDIIREGENGWLFPIEEEVELIRILQAILLDQTSLPAIVNVSKTVEKFLTPYVVDKVIKEISKNVYKA